MNKISISIKRIGGISWIVLIPDRTIISLCSCDGNFETKFRTEVFY